MPFMNIIYLIMFGLSFYRVRLIKKALPNPKNKRLLNFAIYLTGSMIVVITIALILWIFNLWNQGIYDNITLTTYILIYFDTIVICLLFFLMTTQLNFEFTLSTKVQADGQTLIVFLDKRGTEMAKLYFDCDNQTR